MKFLPLLFLSLACFACADSASSEAPAAQQTEEKKLAPDEEELILRLSYLMPRDTITQEGYDRQLIVNYAMDNLIDLKATQSGLFYQIVDPGEGGKVQWGDKLRVHYVGTFMDGDLFNSSYEKEKPMEFYVGNTIQGWNEGLQLIAPGGKMRLIVPSDLAYGQKGLTTPDGRELVPPNEILLFDLEVLERTESTEYE